MSVRIAKESDLPVLLRMGRDFFNASGYGQITSYSEADIKTLMLELIKQGTLVTDGKSSMLGFVTYPVFVNMSTLTSQELFWWVDESARGSGVGLKILKKAESIAREQGAKAFMMLSIDSLDGDRVGNMYERMGYKLKEKAYMRVL